MNINPFHDVPRQTAARDWLPSRRKAFWGMVLLGLIAAGAAGGFLYFRPSTGQLLQKAIRLADRGDREAAISLFDKVLQRNPSEGMALLYRGQLARDRGDTAAAAQFWGRVPDHPPQEAATARFLEGTLFLNAYRARQAEAAFRKAVELNPDYLQPHERLAMLHNMQLRASEMRRELEAIRRFRPWTLDELYGFIFVTGIKEHIIERVEKFVEADPDDRYSHLALARYLLLDDRPAEAARVVQSVCAQNPGDGVLWACLAEARLGQFELAEAREALSRAAVGPNADVSVWRAHGFYSMAVGDWRQAAACLRRAVTLAPDDRTAVYKLGMALERLAEKSAARRQFRHAELLLELHTAMLPIVDRNRTRPEIVAIDAVIQAGTLLMELDRNGDAVFFFEKALALNPNSTAAQQGYERALERTQNSPPQNAETSPPAGFAVEAAPIATKRVPVATPKPTLKLNPPSIQLVDCHETTGLDFQYFNGECGLKRLLETIGGGVAILDYDGDGWPDLFFPQACPVPFDPADATYIDRLYRNLGNGKFADITAGSGVGDNQYSQGCAAGDCNNDGFSDLAVANYGTNVLYQNNGDGTFADVTSATGIHGTHWSTSLAWGDLDRDGNLDLYIVNYVLDPLRTCRDERGSLERCHLKFYQADADVLYLSRGDGDFEEATDSTDMMAADGRGLGVVIGDLNDDGWPDVYVANDEDPSFLFHNLGRGAGKRLAFAEIGFPSGTAVNGEGNAMAGMGIACADLDGNGRLDLFVTNFYREADTLYLNQSDLLFEEAALRAGLAEPTRLMTGWGTQAIDLDLDGRLDLFVANGHTADLRDEGGPWKMPSQLFYNMGHGRFAEISHASGEFFHGEYLGRGVARLDWDRDGRPDLVVVYQDRPAALLRNETQATGHRLILELHGVESNRDAIGARLRATCRGTTQVLEICGGDGFLATNERRQILGIGSAKEVDLLEIQWPGGRKDCWPGVPADSDLLLIEGQPPRIKGIEAERLNPPARTRPDS